MENNQEEKKSNNKILFILLGVLFLGNLAFAWLWWQERSRANTVIVEKEQVIVERESVKTDLLALQQEYGTLKTNDKAVQAELDSKRAEIADLLAQADKHKDDAFIISKLRKETETLRKIMKHFVVEIDSLNTLNKTVIAEKEKVSADLNTEKTKTSQLSKDKEALLSTVNLGSILKASNPIIKAVKFKSGGKKEIEVTKASHTEKIKVSFTLSENKIAKAGVKPVYVRIVSPDGKEITKSPEEGNMFKFNGSRGYFAGKQDVNYKNEEIAVDVLCGSPKEFVPGKYIITIGCDDVVIGESTITLK
jgi:cell division protein FtsL